MIADLFIKSLKAYPKSLEILDQIIEDPKRAIESLDLLIRSPSTPQESRKRYQQLRSAIENYALEQAK